MQAPPQPSAASVCARPGVLVGRQLQRLAICTAVLGVCFARPLFDLARLALGSDLYSHVLLIPFISFYLAWLRKDAIVRPTEIPSQKSYFALLSLGAGLLSIASFLWLRSSLRLAPVDAVAWTTFSFFLLFLAACAFCLSPGTLRELAFPIGFLIFLVPFPVAVKDAIEAFLQHRSADVAQILFGIVGTPLLRNGVDFQLPGFGLQVAPECSGIRSTFVLFISSLIAGQLFLRSPWKRVLFALTVIPLGILRNAFRIVVIGELCVHVDPGFIDSPLHRRGGPVFFVISMVPFLLLLWWLRRIETRKGADPHG